MQYSTIQHSNFPQCWSHLLQVCLSDSYNAMDMPQFNASIGPLEVGYSLLLVDIYGVEHSDFTININVFLTLNWFDDRINVTTDDQIHVDVKFIDNLWKPDVYFYDLKVKFRIDGLTLDRGGTAYGAYGDDVSMSGAGLY